jgi:hypothetical protein
MSDRLKVSHGRATASLGKPFYGKPTIVINAPVDAFDDLLVVVEHLRRLIRNT